MRYMNVTCNEFMQAHVIQLQVMQGNAVNENVL